MAMPLRTFSVGKEMYTEFKIKVNSIRLTNGDRVSVSAALRGLIRLYLDGKITNSQLIEAANQEVK